MKKLIKSFFDKMKRDRLTGEKACYISKYGVDYKFDKILNEKILSIECQILDKIKFSRHERLLALLVPIDQVELYKGVEKYFSEKGFKTFYAGKEEIEELGNNKYLFISWDI